MQPDRGTPRTACKMVRLCTESPRAAPGAGRTNGRSHGEGECRLRSSGGTQSSRAQGARIGAGRAVTGLTPSDGVGGGLDFAAGESCCGKAARTAVRQAVRRWSGGEGASTPATRRAVAVRIIPRLPDPWAAAFDPRIGRPPLRRGPLGAAGFRVRPGRAKIFHRSTKVAEKGLLRLAKRRLARSS